ncbi:M50 family metallopeptidase [Mesorhizobium sp.]|uniref:M50 family metallopeptidase n=1 Tax=Mesorhizobium sp. TaxID=1871066 RepID=UPI00356883BD
MQRFGWDKKNDAFVFSMSGNIPVRISWTFAVPIILPFLHEWPTSPASALSHTAVFAVLLFVSVFLHEFGHLWAARRLGIGTDKIELYLFGGVTWFKRGSTSSYGWVWIAFAGPVANIVLAAGFAAFYYLFVRPFSSVEPDVLFNSPVPRPTALLDWAIWVGALLNVVLALINLLPAYPLDGGTIARHLLARRFGTSGAARIVGFCGVILSILRFAIILPAAVVGVLLWIPPSFKPNWRAFRGNRRKKADPPLSPPEPADEVDWRGKGGRPITR